MAYPNIRSNTVIAQFPYTETQSFRTTAEDGECGQRYSRYERATPLCRWELTYSSLDATEAAALIQHFQDMGGRRGTFSFTNPRDNVAHANCRYDMDAIEVQYLEPRKHAVKIVILEHA